MKPSRRRASRIRAQALALGAIPIAFLLLLLAVVAVLRFEIETVSVQVRHAERVLKIERDITASLIRASNAFSEYARKPTRSGSAAVDSALNVEPLARQLEGSLRDDPAQERRASSLAALAHQLADYSRATKAAFDAHDRRKFAARENSARARSLSGAWERQTSDFEVSEIALRSRLWSQLTLHDRIFDLVLAIGALIGIVLTMISSIAFARRIVGRIERLAAAARRLQKGHDLPKLMEGDDEIAQLDRVYHEMAHEVRQREAQLQKYRLLAEHARDTILFIRRSDWRIVEANAAASRAYGYTPEELARMNARDLRAPEALSRLDAELDRAEAAPLIFETVHRRKDGSTFPVEIAAQGAVIQDERLMVEIIRDITERRMAQQEIQAALKQAVAASRLKSEFLATMSHEIRTPLNAVIGMTELLLQSELTEDQQRCATVAHDSGEALLHLINDILDFSKIEAKRIDLEIIEFQLVSLIEGVAGLFAPQAARKRVGLMTYVSPWISRVLMGDPGRLRQVMLNLVGNAVKFTENGSILIAADLQREDGQTIEVAFSVKDTGIGIAPEAISGLFEPFRQADGSMTRRYGGTGLGLSISKGLVELMGGSMAVQSVVDHGSTFSFTLPLKRAETQPAEPPNLGELRALVLDDDPIAQEVFARYLTSWRMRCETTGDAFEACRMVEEAAARHDAYDVILVDMMLPQMDGFEFARRVQPAVGAMHTRLIMVTAYDEPERGREAIAAGFSAYLTKPVRQSQLYDCIVDASPVPVIPAPQQSGHSEPFAQHRVLVAEDNAINREVALRQLGKLGYAAQAVSDGRRAVEAVASGQFDLVLMDCQMPEMDGFEATRAIRKAEARSGKRVRIVAMTANAMAEDRQACLDAGMDDYISKPVTLESLRRALVWDGTPALDLERLNELFEGDRAAIAEFLASALPALLQLIKKLEGAPSVAEQLAVAHELKGAAANASAVEIARIASECERQLREGNAGLQPLMSRLYEAYERAASVEKRA